MLSPDQNLLTVTVNFLHTCSFRLQCFFVNCDCFTVEPIFYRLFDFLIIFSTISVASSAGTYYFHIFMNWCPFLEIMVANTTQTLSNAYINCSIIVPFIFGCVVFLLTHIIRYSCSQPVFLHYNFFSHGKR